MLPVVPLVGRVVGEPQLKFAQTGNAVARLRVKAADRRKDAETGKWEDTEVLWVTVTVFGKQAENAMESLVDGDEVIAVGKWSTAEWTDQSGTRRSAPRFIAQAIGPGLQFAPRRHSPETMAKHQTPVAANLPQGVDPAAAHGYGHRFADAAVAGQAGQGGGTPADDPWA